MKEYYKYAITLNPDDYTKRKYWKGLDESLAIHLALAFVYLGLEKEDSLFLEFWNIKNIKRHKEFISFIGRSCIARNEDDQPEDSKINKDKLVKFWDWALINADKETLSGFGFWVNPDKEILDDAIVIEKLAETIKKTNGDIEWDYGFLRRLTIFAKKNGEKTFEVIKNYLLDSSDNLNKNRTVPLHDQEIKESLSIIYDNGSEIMKQKVRDLVNILIEKGSSMFWGLKEVIK